MFYSTCNPDSFNKTIHSAQGTSSFSFFLLHFLGTLVQNWHEERILREETGEGRTLPSKHINKNHDDLFRKPVNELGSVYQQAANGDETFGRVFGRKHEPNYLSEHRDKYIMRFNLY